MIIHDRRSAAGSTIDNLQMSDAVEHSDVVVAMLVAPLVRAFKNWVRSQAWSGPGQALAQPSLQ